MHLSSLTCTLVRAPAPTISKRAVPKKSQPAKKPKDSKIPQSDESPGSDTLTRMKSLPTSGSKISQSDESLGSDTPKHSALSKMNSMPMKSSKIAQLDGPPDNGFNDASSSDEEEEDNEGWGAFATEEIVQEVIGQGDDADYTYCFRQMIWSHRWAKRMKATMKMRNWSISSTARRTPIPFTVSSRR